MREENQKLRAEISDLASSLDKQRKQNADLSAKISDLSQKDFKIDKYSIGEITSLKNAIKRLDIPSEVQVATDVKSTILFYLTICIVFVAISWVVAISGITINRDSEEMKIGDRVYSKKHIEWVIDYAYEMSQKNPKTHSKYVKTNPIPN